MKFWHQVKIVWLAFTVICPIKCELIVHENLHLGVFYINLINNETPFYIEAVIEEKISLQLRRIETALGFNVHIFSMIRF